MKAIRIATAALLAAAITAGCTEHPAAVERRPPARPAFEGGGYMGNGGVTPARDTTGAQGGEDAPPPPPPDPAPGGVYPGDGG